MGKSPFFFFSFLQERSESCVVLIAPCVVICFGSVYHDPSPPNYFSCWSVCLQLHTVSRPLLSHLDLFMFISGFCYSTYVFLWRGSLLICLFKKKNPPRFLVNIMIRATAFAERTLKIQAFEGV